MSKVFKENDSAQSITDVLNGIEKYNPANKEFLEQYVKKQASDESYNLEAYLALLQLYKFYPHLVNHDISYTILLKCLTKMPRPDFSIAKALLLPQQMNDLTVRVILDMSEFLESADFPAFWQLAYELPAMFCNIKGFFDAIRRYICYLVDLTFNKINKSTLNLLLGNIEDAEIIEWVRLYNWKQVDDFVLIENEVSQNKNRVIQENIDMENVIALLARIR
ncbi:eukaryotic translation initiation factor 3 subunit K-like [Teleopsis dalmanni]|uniref:eukaryotic translation initiation factor 3 subunit K-like n=1 Tax=Teleopsis dalmanni TaxID=139649 RepID=UPI0018CEEAAB|nr:eukaryotic translation initiation factor 3 subunit K-like [Teleopsis dalmanni]